MFWGSRGKISTVPKTLHTRNILEQRNVSVGRRLTPQSYIYFKIAWAGVFLFFFLW